MMFQEWTNSQRRVYLDTAQVYEAFTDVYRKSRSFRGGMHWKKSKGREYLFRTLDRNGYGKSLGPRSPETAQILERFQHNKQAVKERLAAVKTRLAEQARFCKAARLDRVPRLVTGILRLLEQQGILGKNLLVVGTHAMFAYEVAAGIFLDSPILATGDIDLLWDVRPPLKLVGDKTIRNEGLIGILKKADRTFAPAGQRHFRAVNNEGFMVDLIKPEPRRIIQRDRRRMGENGDLEAAEIRNLQWLIASPKFHQIIIGDDGYPAGMTAPDPRAFALHKQWLSQQADRDSRKKTRDHEQGLAVARLTLQYLPNYPFAPSELRMFPKDVTSEGISAFSGEDDLPVGFDLPED